MEELIGRISAALGIDEALASKAVGIVLNLLKSAGPEDKVSQLLAAIPGASEMLDKAGESGGGGLGGLMGSLGGMMGGSMGGAMGAMSAFTELKDAGLDTDQVQGLGKEVLSFAKEKAGEDVVGEVVSSIPGLDQFI
ncbi:MAG: hypothetical protein C0605_06205 [Hyphomicrobiales bacterium]|nr:MAG: hypothetical protein C0605_06205 [Hyphomicrobiales bacterium]